MKKKLYEVDFDDDLHLADAANDPGYKRGLLYDDDGNLKSHAKMREVDEDELRDRFAERDTYDYDYDYDSEREDSELTPEQQELARLAGEFLAGMLITFIAVATPHVQHWWEVTAAPGISGFFGGIADFFRGIGRKDKTTEEQNKRTATLQLAEASLQIDPRDIQTKLDAAYEDYRENMSSEEAQKNLVEIAILSSMLADRIKKLSNANITDSGITGGYVGWQATVKRLSSQELINDVNRILEGDVRRFDAAQITSLETILGRSLYANEQYIPIEVDEFHERLMPGREVGTSGNSDNDDSTITSV